MSSSKKAKVAAPPPSSQPRLDAFFKPVSTSSIANKAAKAVEPAVTASDSVPQQEQKIPSSVPSPVFSVVAGNPAGKRSLKSTPSKLFSDHHVLDFLKTLVYEINDNFWPKLQAVSRIMDTLLSIRFPSDPLLEAGKPKAMAWLRKELYSLLTGRQIFDPDSITKSLPALPPDSFNADEDGDNDDNTQSSPKKLKTPVQPDRERRYNHHMVLSFRHRSAVYDLLHRLHVPVNSKPAAISYCFPHQLELDQHLEVFLHDFLTTLIPELVLISHCSMFHDTSKASSQPRMPLVLSPLRTMGSVKLPLLSTLLVHSTLTDDYSWLLLNGRETASEFLCVYSFDVEYGAEPGASDAVDYDVADSIDARKLAGEMAWKSARSLSACLADQLPLLAGDDSEHDNPMNTLAWLSSWPRTALLPNRVLADRQAFARVAFTVLAHGGPRGPDMTSVLRTVNLGIDLLALGQGWSFYLGTLGSGSGSGSGAGAGAGSNHPSALKACLCSISATVLTAFGTIATRLSRSSPEPAKVIAELQQFDQWLTEGFTRLHLQYVHTLAIYILALRQSRSLSNPVPWSTQIEWLVSACEPMVPMAVKSLESPLLRVRLAMVLIHRNGLRSAVPEFSVQFYGGGPSI